MVHDALKAVGRGSHQQRRSAAAAIGCAALLAGCGGSGGSKRRPDYGTGPGVAASIRTADCSDWQRGDPDRRHRTVVQLREFAGGPVGSSAGIQTGPVLDDNRAYRVLQSYCVHYFARGFKLYKLYERAAAFAGG